MATVFNLIVTPTARRLSSPRPSSAILTAFLSSALMPTSSALDRTPGPDVAFPPSLVRGRGYKMASADRSQFLVLNSTWGRNTPRTTIFSSQLSPSCSVRSQIDHANVNPVSAGDATLCHQRKATEANIFSPAQAYRLAPEPGNFSGISAAMAASPPPLHWILPPGLRTHRGIQ